MLDMLRVKSIPVASWSSPAPLIFLPAPLTFSALCFGLVLFGLGEALLINAGVGVSPWTVLSQGVAKRVGVRIHVAMSTLDSKFCKCQNIRKQAVNFYY